jgi:hypothetical protein
MAWHGLAALQALQMKQLVQQSEGTLTLPKGSFPLPDGVTLPAALALGPCGLARRSKKATFFAAVQARGARVRACTLACETSSHLGRHDSHTWVRTPSVG